MRSCIAYGKIKSPPEAAPGPRRAASGAAGSHGHGKRRSTATLDGIQSALEAAGVEFLAPNGRGPGVRLRMG